MARRPVTAAVRSAARHNILKAQTTRIRMKNIPASRKPRTLKR